MSQLLSRLKAAAASSKTDSDRGEALARCSCYLSRVGDFDEAVALIADLRKTFDDGHSGRVTVWIMLAEALLHHYRDLSIDALDRVNRALLLSTAMGYQAGIANAAAWKAHIEFETSSFQGMVSSLKVAIAAESPADRDAATRAAMVLSNSFLLFGDARSGQHWFTVGREHALANGDQASIEALLYNRTAFGLANLRAAICLGALPASHGSMRTEIESAINLQKLTQINALTNHVHLWRARLQLLEGNFDEAVASFKKSRAGSPFANHNFSQAMIDLEILYCEAHLDSYIAIAQPPEFLLSNFGDLDIDERLYIAWLLAKIAARNAALGKVEERESQLKLIQKDYLDFCARIIADLAPWKLT